jgi:hypothetical protein
MDYARLEGVLAAEVRFHGTAGEECFSHLLLLEEGELVGVEGRVGLRGVSVGEANAGVDGGGELDGGDAAVSVDRGSGFSDEIEWAEGDEAEDACVSADSVAGAIGSIDRCGAGHVGVSGGASRLVVHLKAHDLAPGNIERTEVLEGLSSGGILLLGGLGRIREAAVRSHWRGTQRCDYGIPEPLAFIPPGSGVAGLAGTIRRNLRIV